MSNKLPTIIDACSDPKLFGPWFKKPASWKAWHAFLAALFGHGMTTSELAIYQQCTGRTTPPTQQAREAWLIVGRRGGKSFIIALVAVFLACFRDYRQYLTPGERGVVMVLACDRKQARTIFRYARALLQNVPMLKRLIDTETADSIKLSNNINIEIHTASFRAVRGYTVVAALCDEIAFWRSDESANPDSEILAALRPAMATIPNAVLIGVSSPYARRGVLWESYRDHYGKDGDVLVWQAETRTMNPGVPQTVINEAYARDPLSAAAEYGAQFRSDIAAFLHSEWIDAATLDGVHEIEFRSGNRYFAFADPSGGGADSFTLCIAHQDSDGTLHLNALRSRRPPFDSENVVQDFAAVLKGYGLSVVTGDRYAGEWVPSAFRKHGIAYEHSELNRSEIYLEAEPLFATGRVRLLDHRALLTELRQLERRTGRGRDIIDHPPRGHDDLANSAAGALVLASQRRTTASPQGARILLTPRDVVLNWQAEHTDSPWPIGDDPISPPWSTTTSTFEE